MTYLTTCPDCEGPTGESSHVDGCCEACVCDRIMATIEEQAEAEYQRCKKYLKPGEIAALALNR